MPGTIYTGSSESDRGDFYHDHIDRHSSVSTSVHSPASSGTNSSVGNDWPESAHGGDYDGVDSAAHHLRSRRQSSRRHQTEAPTAPETGRSSSRHVAIDQEEPQRRPSHRQRSSRPYHRSESRRVPSDESGSTVASHDDYPYHHGMPQRTYRHVPASHGGYPPSMGSAPGGYDPFQQPQALVHMPHSQTDAFGYPTANPFAPPVSNPFSPMSTTGASAGHFPEPQMQTHRPPPRPMSMYSGSGYGSELYHPGHAGYAYPHIYPQVPYMYPSSQATSPGERGGATSKELESMRELMKKQEEASVARHEAMIAQAKAEAAAAAAKLAKEQEEAKRKEEIAAASAKAKDEAERKAKEAADKAKEESDKKLAESEKAKKAAEEKKKELEEQIKKSAPHPDASKEPIKFKDAVHRKFSFPWSICKTWKGTEGLIKQAFQHVDMIGPHVMEGHYDLLGPDGEIILPQVWDTTVQPGWEVEMHMWPIPELDQPKPIPGDDPFAGIDLDHMMGGLDIGRNKKGRGSKKDKKPKRSSQIVDVPIRGAIPVPPQHGGGVDPIMNLFPGGIDVGPSSKARSSSSRRRNSQLNPFAAWVVGGSRGRR